MILLNPHHHTRAYDEQRSRDIMRKTIAFFETRGKRKLTDDDHTCTWYADFLAFQKQERIFATLLTPPEYGEGDCRWDTWRNFEFNEILAFYGLAYWYTWQVSMLGLGPLWMSKQESLKRQAARLLQEGEVFAFGLSEQHHGADISATEMQLTPQADGSYLAEGSKYYIGNANTAPMVSTFGKMADTGDYVFFTVDSRHPAYTCMQNVCHSQNFVAEFRLHKYPITAHDIVSRGQDAWDSVLNTVNIGKWNLGGAAIGMCTHALYEALNHAASRQLYGRYVTDFPHVKQLLIDAYTRLVAMKLFALRTLDYMRGASPGDRRYILYNTMVKIKVTTQGETVINLLADVIAAKGFEKDTYFAIAARDIRALPKLEGTVHVNLALIAKFIVNYFFSPAVFPDVPQRSEPRHDAFLFNQGPTRGLGHIQFHDYQRIFAHFDLPNVRIFQEQIVLFKAFLARATPHADQRLDTDFSVAIAEIFALVVYGQLILENVTIYDIDDATVDQIFDVLVRDFSIYALQLHNKSSTTAQQMQYCFQMLRKPAVNPQRYQRVWKDIYALKGLYEMPA
jgi:acyl-CoA dehydrogenase